MEEEAVADVEEAISATETQLKNLEYSLSRDSYERCKMKNVFVDRLSKLQDDFVEWNDACDKSTEKIMIDMRRVCRRQNTLRQFLSLSPKAADTSRKLASKVASIPSHPSASIPSRKLASNPSTSRNAFRLPEDVSEIIVRPSAATKKRKMDAQQIIQSGIGTVFEICVYRLPQFFSRAPILILFHDFA